ncbi:polymorphic toxin type 24 domain-containing protein [Pseudomonas entomophila]|uniref:polymorphic toxin type 24 domain-containing protein n=1 Tax=Pseudomonas entomophila TaxID=312306 RepID=UPI002405F936|nr:polymorphic toxin type 24 domain-containing protein [Pseudomonas entomophila]MDF9617968.1 polymorphic toxin type 24 domain-containing protein [Pseudomonas entomophila]
MATWNDQTMRHFREISRDPGESKQVATDKGLNFMEKRLPDGRGVRLNMDETFKGFIDLAFIPESYEITLQKVSKCDLHALLEHIEMESQTLSGLAVSEEFGEGTSAGINKNLIDEHGRILKRVDVTGAAHAGVPTPHVLEYGRNTLPNGVVRVNSPSSKLPPRPATAEEIP